MQNQTSAVTPSPKRLSDLGGAEQPLLFRGCDVVIYPGNPVTFSVRPGTTTGVVFLDEEETIALLRTVVGKGKPVSKKQRWAGVYWFLRWVCNYPVDTREFCAGINALPGADMLEVPCDYNSIRHMTTLKFMDYDPRYPDTMKVSSGELRDYAVCREVFYAMLQKIGKMQG